MAERHGTEPAGEEVLDALTIGHRIRQLRVDRRLTLDVHAPSAS